MALARSKQSLDESSLEIVTAAQKEVARAIQDLQARGIPIYYRETPDGPLIQELPSGEKIVIAPPIAK